MRALLGANSLGIAAAPPSTVMVTVSTPDFSLVVVSVA